jgi:protein SCO1/2
MQRVLVIIVVLAMSASLGALLFLRNRSRTPSTAEDYAHLPVKARPPALWPSPDFSFRAHTGDTASKASLTGKPYIANFIFTTCRTVCPLLTTKMVRLQRQLPGADVRFVSFSVDPEHDTVDALATYAKQWNPDESRWLLLETTNEGLAKVAEGFHVTAQKTDGGLDAVMHSAVFLLVDGQGVVRGAFDSETPEDFTALLAQTRALLGKQTEVAATPPRSGEALFHELSCTNCHERAELAPALGGLKGQRRTLDTGLLVNADDAYVKESILAPDAKRVAGYPLRMPSYVGVMTDDELTSLVAYVGSLPAPVAAAPDVAIAVDPVCHMKVRVTENALQSAGADGGVTYFCSAWCKSRFAENPDAYRR